MGAQMKLLLALLAALVAPSEALVLGSHPGSALQARPSHSSAASSLRKIRLQSDPPPVPPPSGRLGATVDQDGKSNVWAVEPTMKVEGGGKGMMAFAPVAGVALLALLAVPLLPLLFAANPDQAWDGPFMGRFAITLHGCSLWQLSLLDDW